jgi:signal peptidase I
VPAVPREKPWVGVGLSLLVPGLGIMASGRGWEGATWMLGLTVLGYFTLWTFSVRVLPGFLLGFLTCGVGVAMWGLMLRRSYAPVPRLRAGRWVRAVVASLVFSVTTFLVGREIVRPFRVPTGAMNPTVQGTINPVDGSKKEADHLLVQGCAYWFAQPRRGDVIVFRTAGIEAMESSQWGQYYIKRLIGLPGDRISFRDGRLFNNGVAVEEPAVFVRLRYDSLHPPWAKHLGREGEVFEVPPEAYFVVGDNSTNSYDSRFWGVLPAKNVFGRATKVYWPPDRAGAIE